MFGYTEMEAVGEPIYLIVPDDKRDEEAELLRRLTLGERIETFETTRRHREGRLVPISITISPIKSRAGKLVGASSIARDVTRTRESERHRIARLPFFVAGDGITSATVKALR